MLPSSDDRSLRTASSLAPLLRARGFASSLLAFGAAALSIFASPQLAHAEPPRFSELAQLCNQSDCASLRRLFDERTLQGEVDEVDGSLHAGAAPHAGHYLVGLTAHEEGCNSSLLTHEALRTGDARICLNQEFSLRYSASESALLGSTPFSRATMLSRRRLAMDRAKPTLRAGEAENNFGVQGEGVLLAAIDSGIDITHPDFLQQNGETRVAWYLVFGRSPAGYFPDLEEQFGCNLRDDCAVFSATEINDALASNLPVVLGQDRDGHGSHVASIMGGRAENYGGIAQAAEYIAVKALSSDGTISDERILLGVAFAYDRAQAMGRPLVTNLSLGSNFGAHDGQSGLERALASFVGEPGMAMVVAAGNEATVYEDLNRDYPNPQGQATEVSLSQEQTTRLPLFAAGSSALGIGTWYLWLEASTPRQLSIAFSTAEGSESNWIEPGENGSITSRRLGATRGDFEVFLLNAHDDAAGQGSTGLSTIVIIDGELPQDQSFEILLRGEGKVRAWSEGLGDFSPQLAGVFLPRAREASSIAIPASSSALIAVGSTTNRLRWESEDGSIWAYRDSGIGQRSSFSGAGPTSLGVMKPEVMAPGGMVIAAMARTSDPRLSTNTNSNFAGAGFCPSDSPYCLVVDDESAISLGTSMAAPMVAGALALALSRQPELTQADLKELLLASTAPVQGDEQHGLSGAGLLDIEALLQAQDLREEAKSAEPAAAETRFAFADSSVTPGGKLEGYLLLRAADGSPAGQMERSRLQLNVEGAATLSAAWLNDEASSTLPLGALAFTLQAEQNAGLSELVLEARLDGERLSRAAIPVYPDARFEAVGYSWGAGGCSYEGAHSGKTPLLLLALLLVGLGARRRLTASVGAQRVGPPGSDCRPDPR